MSDSDKPTRLPACHGCQREFREGESAWATDWKVLITRGNAATWKTETRLICDDCEAAA